MSVRKSYRIVAMSGCSVLSDTTVYTRKDESAALKDALSIVADAGSGVILRQTVGAKGWGVYELDQISGSAGRLHPDAAAPFVDAWLRLSDFHLMENSNAYRN